jgi:hypothetical protein
MNDTIVGQNVNLDGEGLIEQERRKGRVHKASLDGQ